MFLDFIISSRDKKSTIVKESPIYICSCNICPEVFYFILDFYFDDWRA